MGKKKKLVRRYKDNRDWKIYHKELIKRGEFYINPRFLSTWNEEVKEMNLGKEGKPYFYPDSMIEFLAVLHSKSYDYRALQGIMNSLSIKYSNFPIISYTQICRRVNCLGLEFNNTGENLIVGVDGSGIKVSNRGDWMRKKYKVKRGWIKVVVLGDSKGNIVDVKVGNENLNEVKASRSLVKKHHKKIKKLLGDGLHDCKETFNLCKRLKIDPVIKIRSNAVEKADGSFLRKKCVHEYKKLGYEKWADEKGYRLRWPCTEGIYSAVKRMFGEYVNSSKKENMYHDAKLKFWSYDQVKNLSSI